MLFNKELFKGMEKDILGMAKELEMHRNEKNEISELSLNRMLKNKLFNWRDLILNIYNFANYDELLLLKDMISNANSAINLIEEDIIVELSETVTKDINKFYTKMI